MVSLRGTRLLPTIDKGMAGAVTFHTITLFVGVGLLYYFSRKPKKEHTVSKRGIKFQSIGDTHLNHQIGLKNAKAHRLRKILATGKFDYSKNSVRDLQSNLYRK